MARQSEDKTIPVAAVQRRLERSQRRLAEIENERFTLSMEVELLRAILREDARVTEAEEGDAKLGPADTIRAVTRANPHGLPRKDLLDQGERIVSTNPKIARRVLDQTIRNLMDRDVREEGGLIFPMSANGHPK